MERFELPGSRACVGCGGLTFRNREDGLCPRCAYQAENLIEQIELESLEEDLNLITRFEAYYRQRELARARNGGGLAFGEPLFPPERLRERPFSASAVALAPLPTPRIVDRGEGTLGDLRSA